MCRVLVIGGGGREHAIAWKLAQSPRVESLYVAPGNAGTAQLGENVPIGCTDRDGLLAFAQANRIDLTVIGQEAASEAGVGRCVLASGVGCVRTEQGGGARIETSKAFAKDLMTANGVPSALVRFEEYRSALSGLAGRRFPLVIKASGLAEGKGVVIATTVPNRLAMPYAR